MGLTHPAIRLQPAQPPDLSFYFKLFLGSADYKAPSFALPKTL
jgi:hypothetical protein